MLRLYRPCVFLIESRKHLARQGDLRAGVLHYGSARGTGDLQCLCQIGINQGIRGAGLPWMIEVRLFQSGRTTSVHVRQLLRETPWLAVCRSVERVPWAPNQGVVGAHKATGIFSGLRLSRSSRLTA